MSPFNPAKTVALSRSLAIRTDQRGAPLDGSGQDRHRAHDSHAGDAGGVLQSDTVDRGPASFGAEIHVIEIEQVGLEIAVDEIEPHRRGS